MAARGRHPALGEARVVRGAVRIEVLKSWRQRYSQVVLAGPAGNRCPLHEDPIFATAAVLSARWEHAEAYVLSNSLGSFLAVSTPMFGWKHSFYSILSRLNKILQLLLENVAELRFLYCK